MADDQGEKTEEPTEHKLQEARKKGQVFKSMEIVSSIQFAVVVLTLSWAGAYGVRSLYFFSQHVYRTIPNLTFRGQDVWLIWVSAFEVMAKMLLPILVAAFLSALLLNILQTGVMFSAEPLNPTFQKISPVEGFKRIFSRKSLAELFKQVFKLIVIGWVSYKILKNALDDMVGMVTWDLHRVMVYAKTLMFHVIWYVTVAYLILAVLDYLIQRKFFMMQMRMSIQELKDEFKETEGDPHVKARMRQMQRQLVDQAISRAVPTSTTVVTNPTHLAVALQYEPGETEAPVVVAKGERLMAERIREIAEEHEIPVIENVALARALFDSCKVGELIPGELYQATAEVLAFVFRLKRKKELSKKRAILRIRTSAKASARKAVRKR